jgi:hypothetical protein
VKDTGSPFVPIGKRMLMLLVAVSLIWLLAAIAWHYAKPLLIRHFVPESYRLLIGEMPTAPQKPKVMLKGNMNGIPLAIPRQYIEFPVEYNDKSIWEARKPGDKKPEQRTFEDAIGAFSLLVRWPEMKPRWESFELKRKFLEETSDGSEHPWLSIGVTARQMIHSKGKEYGYALPLQAHLRRLSERPQESRHRPTSGKGGALCSTSANTELISVHYQLRGLDPASGLQWAEPVGPRTECFHTWNMAWYWAGDMNGLVTDMIKCDNGKLPNPKAYQECTHYYAIPEWGAGVTVTYPRRWLPQWREIRARTLSLVLGMRPPSGSDPTVQPIIDKKSTP